MIDLAAQYSFGTGGSIKPFLKEGWSVLESDFNWTEGTRSRMRLPMPARQGRLTLEIALNPMLMPPVFTRQRLMISVNGHEIASAVVAGECTLGFDLPDAALAGAADLDVELRCPDAMIPAEIGANPDPRRLGVAVREIMLFTAPERKPFTPILRPPVPGDLAQSVRALTFLSIPELAGCFESIGHNCEFGLAQRQMGHEGLGLLRLGGIPVQKLVEGLDLTFEGIDAPGNLATYVAQTDDAGNSMAGEILVHDKRYGTLFHLDRTLRDTTEAAVLETFYRNMTFLRRKFTEDLQTGGKIFVFQHPAADSIAHIRPILNLLRSHGPNTLLFVTQSGRQPPGAVEQLDEDLFQGWVQRLAPVHNVKPIELPSWISICANTYRLWRESGRGQS
jgi:hypothetical protein